MWLSEHLENVFKDMDKEDKKKKANKIEEKVDKDKLYCSEFEKSNNGFCKNYIGCKINIVSCVNECAVDWKRENKEF